MSRNRSPPTDLCPHTSRITRRSRGAHIVRACQQGAARCPHKSTFLFSKAPSGAHTNRLFCSARRRQVPTQIDFSVQQGAARCPHKSTFLFSKAPPGAHTNRLFCSARRRQAPTQIALHCVRPSLTLPPVHYTNLTRTSSMRFQHQEPIDTPTSVGSIQRVKYTE